MRYRVFYLQHNVVHMLEVDVKEARKLTETLTDDDIAHIVYDKTTNHMMAGHQIQIVKQMVEAGKLKL